MRPLNTDGQRSTRSEILSSLQTPRRSATASCMALPSAAVAASLRRRGIFFRHARTGACHAARPACLTGDARTHGVRTAQPLPRRNATQRTPPRLAPVCTLTGRQNFLIGNPQQGVFPQDALIFGGSKNANAGGWVSPMQTSSCSAVCKEASHTASCRDATLVVYP